MIDDHDFRYNDSDFSEGDKQPSAALAKKIFKEQLPVAGTGNQKEDNIYRTHQVNKHLQIWLLDGRFNRDAVLTIDAVDSKGNILNSETKNAV